MRIWTAFVTLAGGITVGVAGLLATDQMLTERHLPPHRLETFERFPNVWLTNHDGQKVRFYDDLLKDKIVALNFFYSSCTEF